jgi:hypothetical protein
MPIRNAVPYDKERHDLCEAKTFIQFSALQARGGTYTRIFDICRAGSSLYSFETKNCVD